MDSGRKNGLWIQYLYHSYIKDLRILENCLNLCSVKWLKLRKTHVISLIPFGIWYSYTELATDLMNWRIFFLNVRKLSQLLRLGSSLFHSEIVVNGKKEFLEETCFDLKVARLCTFLVVYGVRQRILRMLNFK